MALSHLHCVVESIRGGDRARRLQRILERQRRLTVRIDGSAEQVAPMMRRMRQWLDRHRIEPASFDFSPAGADRLVFKLRFRHEAEAREFRRVFRAGEDRGMLKDGGAGSPARRPRPRGGGRAGDSHARHSR